MIGAGAHITPSPATIGGIQDKVMNAYDRLLVGYENCGGWRYRGWEEYDSPATYLGPAVWSERDCGPRLAYELEPEWPGAVHMEFPVAKWTRGDFAPPELVQRVHVSISEFKDFAAGADASPRFKAQQHEAFLEVKWCVKGWSANSRELKSRRESIPKEMRKLRNGSGLARPLSCGAQGQCSTCERRPKPATAAPSSITSSPATGTADSTASRPMTSRRSYASCGSEARRGDDCRGARRSGPHRQVRCASARFQRGEPGHADAVVGTPEGLAGEALADLHARADRAHARRLRRALPHAVHSRRAHRWPRVRALRSHLERHPTRLRSDGADPARLARALLAGERVDVVALLLGHRDATVTRVVYVHEIAGARRRQMRHSRMTADYAGARRVVLQDADRS